MPAHVGELIDHPPILGRDHVARLHVEVRLACERGARRGIHAAGDFERAEALAEGDLSERARRRAAELACDADLRLNPPRSKIPPAIPQQPVSAPTSIDPRLPPPGTILTRPYKGQQLHVQVLTEGFAYAGTVYPSLSAVAKVITGTHTNGYHFFRNALNNNKETA